MYTCRTLITIVAICLLRRQYSEIFRYELSSSVGPNIQTPMSVVRNMSLLKTVSAYISTCFDTKCVMEMFITRPTIKSLICQIMRVIQFNNMYRYKRPFFYTIVATSKN